MSKTACGKWRMNRSTIASHFHTSFFLMIGLLCFCVIMYMLGTTITLWNVEDPTDFFTASVLEGFSLPSIGMVSSVSLQRILYSPSPPLEHEILLAQSLFHPPISHA